MGREAFLEITVSPRSSKSEIKIVDNTVKVYLNSPPVEGKANDECIRLFSKQLKIARSEIIIVSGEKGRRKRLRIQGMSPDEIMKKLKV